MAATTKEPLTASSQVTKCTWKHAINITENAPFAVDFNIVDFRMQNYS